MNQTTFEINQLVAKNGEPILEINQLYIHSKYNPTKEAERYVENHYRAHNLHIIFGYGSGYLVEAFIKFRKHNEVFIVIDPLLDAELLPIRAHHTNILGVKAENIWGMEAIIQEIDSEVRTTFNILCTNNYDKLFPEEYKELLQKIRDIQEMNRINDNTLLLFAEKWQENLAMNLNYMTKDTSIQHLKDKFHYPVVIAASGPSLLKQLPLLKKYRNAIILISAGSTTNVLLKNQISPDFIVTLDGGESNYKHFEHLEFNGPKLIYTFQNHYKIRDSFKYQAFICNLVGHPHVNQYVNKFLKYEIPELLAGSTVANLCFSIAQYITDGPIAFIGQDLAYTNNLSHVQGHNHTKEMVESSLENKDIVLIDAYFGDKIATSASMNSMRLEFEKMILIAPPKNLFFNCTEGGAKIKGFDQIPFEEFLVTYQTNTTTNVQIDLEGYPPISTSSDISNNFKIELVNAEKLIELYKEALSILSKDNALTRFKPSTLKKLDKLDKAISEILQELPLDHILTPTMMAVKKGYLEKENETVYQKFNRIKAQNKKLYESSLEAVEKFCEYVTQALEYNEVES